MWFVRIDYGYMFPNIFLLFEGVVGAICLQSVEMLISEDAETFAVRNLDSD